MFRKKSDNLIIKMNYIARRVHVIKQSLFFYNIAINNIDT